MEVPKLSPNDLIRFSACALNRRLAESDAAGWGRDVARPLSDWATLPSTSTPDLAWAMWILSPQHCGRVLALLLEAILPPDADPRSRAVIPLMRAPERWAAAWAARACAARAWAEGAARAAARAAASRAARAAALARPELDIRALLLREWEKG